MALGAALAGQQPIFSDQAAHPIGPGSRAASSSEGSTAVLTERVHNPLTPHEAKLTASDGHDYDLFGVSVALSGERALIGASADDDAAPGGGSTYVFERQDDGTWAERAKLTASDGDFMDRFGASVALSGKRALVGAYLDDDVGSESGSAYVFEWQDDGTWAERAKLTASDGAPLDYFGASVALSGERALVGADHDNDLDVDCGSVYVFERQDDGTWAQRAKLTASDGAEDDYFGVSVALVGERALIGAHGHDDLGVDSGSAYLFERQGDGTWAERAKLTASDGAPDDSFGISVALSGGRALIGALGDDAVAPGDGSAYVFERQDDGTWAERAKLAASAVATDDFFGRSVALSGERALVGAPGAPYSAVSDPGSAYVFERQDDGTWAQRAKLTASDGAAGDFFGQSLAVSSGRALVGAYGDDADLGSAYVYPVEGCVLEIRLHPLAVRAGEELQISALLEHNRVETVTVPLRLWVEDAAGEVLASRTTPPITFHYGDTMRRELSLEIPEDTPRGWYRVLVGIEQMQQGLAAAAQPFQVVKPSALPPLP